jgi:hypothetical protein
MCSKCFKTMSASAVALPSASQPSAQVQDASPCVDEVGNSSSSLVAAGAGGEGASGSGSAPSPAKARCGKDGCGKKLGLAAIKCKCGGIFCPVHRYSNEHNCDFDFRQAQQKALEQANPVVQGEKVTKI